MKNFSTLLAAALLMFDLAAQAQSVTGKIQDPTPPGKPWKQLEPPKDPRADIQVEGIGWVRFTDPNEHAFSLDLPVGWKALGGAVRRNAIDISVFLRAVSPDKTMMLMSGDPGPAFFHTTGFGPMPSDRGYVGGKDYARAYAETALPPLCSDIKFVSDAQREDIASDRFAIAGAYNHAGEAVFSCSRFGKPAKAYFLAETFNIKARALDEPSHWGVNVLLGWIGPENELERGKKMVARVLFSTQPDPRWIKAQQKKTGEAWARIGSLAQTQTPEWEANRVRAEAQSSVMTQEFNTAPPGNSTP